MNDSTADRKFTSGKFSGVLMFWEKALPAHSHPRQTNRRHLKPDFTVVMALETLST